MSAGVRVVCSALVWVVLVLALMPAARGLPATGGSCDSVRAVMTSLKLAHATAVSDSPVAG